MKLRAEHYQAVIDQQNKELDMANKALDAYVKQLEEKDETIRILESDNAGWVYIMKNENIRGYKVGCTESLAKSPEARALELAGTGVPGSFDVKFKIRVENSYETERNAHTKLKEFRYDPQREFFDCDLETIINTIKEV